MKKNKWQPIQIVFPIIGLIAALVMTGLFVITSINLENTKNQLSQTQSDLIAEQNKSATLTASKSEVDTSYASLQANFTKLNKDYSDVKTKWFNAQTQVDRLICKADGLNMDYTNNSTAAIRLQNFLSTMPDVREVSYVIPERIYSNTLSQLYYVTYVSKTDGQVYSRRFIVYQAEFGWSKGTFDMDGQCWLDKP
jgi:hypothetical protein